MNYFKCCSFMVVAVCVLFSSISFAGESSDKTFDGLERVKDSKAAEAYVLPGTDFSQYTRVMLAEPQIAFKKNWARDHRGADIRRISERLKQRFKTTFVDVLEEGGYPVVYEAGENVLLLRAGLIDLDITAPDTMSPGRSTVYASSAGSATFYIEIYDSISGQILARAIDPKKDRDSSQNWMMPMNSVTNAQKAQQALTYWATLLKNALDRVHGKPQK